MRHATKREIARAGTDYAMTCLEDLPPEQRQRLRRLLEEAILNSLEVFRELRKGQRRRYPIRFSDN